MVNTAPRNTGVKIALCVPASVPFGAYPEVGLHNVVDHLGHSLRGSLHSPTSPTFAQTVSTTSFRPLGPCCKWLSCWDKCYNHTDWQEHKSHTSPALLGPQALPVSSSVVLERHVSPHQQLSQTFTTPLKCYNLPGSFLAIPHFTSVINFPQLASHSTLIIFALIIIPALSPTYLIFFFKSFCFAVLIYLWATPSRRSLLCYTI